MYIVLSANQGGSSAPSAPSFPTSMESAITKYHQSIGIRKILLQKGW